MNFKKILFRFSPRSYFKLYTRFCTNKNNGNKDLSTRSIDTSIETTKAELKLPKILGNQRTISIRRENRKIDPIEYIDEIETEPIKCLLFSSKIPIIPFSNFPGTIKSPHLSDADLELPMCYSIGAENGQTYTVGVVLDKNLKKEIKNVLKKSPSNYPKETFDIRTKIKAKGFTRAKILEIENKGNVYYAYVVKYKDQNSENNDNTKNLLKSIVQNVKKMTETSINTEDSPVAKDLIEEEEKILEFSKKEIDEWTFKVFEQVLLKYIGFTKLNYIDIVQDLLEIQNQEKRLELLNEKCEEVIDILKLLNLNKNENVDNQNEKAKMSIEYIRKLYLNDANQPIKETPNKIKHFYKELEKVDLPDSKEKLKMELDRLAQMEKHSGEYSKLIGYFEETFKLPWGKYATKEWNIEHAAKVLNEKVFGLEEVKKRILETIVVKKLGGQNKGFIIMLYGAPGTGKTSIAKAIAESLERPMKFISFAGVSDSTFIKGHRRTYVDSLPGVFIRELSKSEVMNPIFVIDEIDKVSRNSTGGDPYYSLLEILNPEENSNFVDHYMDFRVDFSQVYSIFILVYLHSDCE